MSHLATKFQKAADERYYRYGGADPIADLYGEAADEITRLTTELAAAERKAIDAPFLERNLLAAREQVEAIQAELAETLTKLKNTETDLASARSRGDKDLRKSRRVSRQALCAQTTTEETQSAFMTQTYSFDDNAIGPLSQSGQSLARGKTEIDRPPGLTNSQWYEHASKVCIVINGLLRETLEMAAKIADEAAAQALAPLIPMGIARAIRAEIKL